MNPSDIRILFVEDDPDVLAGTARLLEKAGYTVDRAASGEEALLAVQKHRPDLLLLDHDLPGINGTEVCRRIKQDPALVDSLVVIVSASHAESDQQAEGLELGADGYIGRPIGNRELLARVQSYVRIQCLTRSLHLQAEELKHSYAAASQAHLATLNLMADAVAARERLEIANLALQRENTARRLAEEMLRVHHVELQMQAAELRQSQAALDAARERYFDLYDLAPVGYVTVTEPGLILESNLAAATLLGVVRSELVKQPLSRFILPEEHDTYYRHRQQLLDTGNPQACEFRMVRSDGTPFWAHLAATVAPEKEGASTLRIVLSDITARKLAEQALQASETKYRTLIETTGTGYLVLDWQGRVTDANGEYVRLSGHQELREILGRSVLEWTAEYEKRKNAEAVARCVKDGTVRNLVIDYVDATGRVTPVEISATYGGQGEAARIISICRDITARRQAEQTLLEREERLSFLLSSTPAVIYTCRVSGDFGATFVSENVQSQLGHRASEFVEEPAFWAQHVHPADVQRVFAELSNLLAQGSHAHEYRFRHQDGTYRWMHDQVRVVCDAAGQPTMLIGSWLDITARQQAEAALRESEAKLRSVIDCSPVPLAINDEQGNITYVNREFTKTYGYTLGDIPTLAAWWQKAYPDPTYQAEVKTHWQLRLNQTLQEGKAFAPAEVNIRCQDGSQRIALDGAAPLTGTFAGTHLVVLYDITVRKQAEAALRQKAEALRASNAELELFNRAMIGRELRMIELKQEINELCRRLGEPPRHETDPLPTNGGPGVGPVPAGGGGV